MYSYFWSKTSLRGFSVSRVKERIERAELISADSIATESPPNHTRRATPITATRWLHAQARASSRFSRSSRRSGRKKVQVRSFWTLSRLRHRCANCISAAACVAASILMYAVTAIAIQRVSPPLRRWTLVESQSRIGEFAYGTTYGKYGLIKPVDYRIAHWRPKRLWLR